MSNFKVTLAELRKAGACYDGYNRLVRGLQKREFTHNDADRITYIRLAHKELIDIEFIANNNGLDDALWALRCVKNEDRSMRLYAVWCARQVEYLMEDQRSKDTLNVAEAFADGLVNSAELAAADAAAWAAALAARAAAWAAWDAAGAGAAAGAAAWAAQKEMLINMCRGEAPWQKGCK